MKCYGSLKRPYRSLLQSARGHGRGLGIRIPEVRRFISAGISVRQEQSSAPLRITHCVSRARARSHEDTVTERVQHSSAAIPHASRLAHQHTRTNDETQPHGETTDRALRTFAQEINSREGTKNIAKHVRLRHQKLAKKYADQKARQPRAKHWSVTLKLLDNNTPADAKLYRKKLVRVDLPAGTSAEFKGNAGVAIAEIMERTNCHVQMAPGKIDYKSNRADTFTALNLLGTFRENSEALGLLPEYVVVRDSENARMRLSKPLAMHSSEIEHVSLYAETDNMTDQISHESAEADRNERLPIRAVWSRRLEEIGLEGGTPQRPTAFTTLSMSAYISDLCRAKALQRQVTRPVLTSEGVAEELVSLFRDPTLARFLTPRSLSMIIDFLEKTSLAAFRELAQHLGNAEYAFTASNWDRILAATAKDGDVHNHRYTLRAMLRQGLKPTPRTWATLHDLVCRRSPSEAHIVATAMHEKGILHDRAAAQLVARNAVEYELSQFIAKGKGVEAFIRFYDNQLRYKYGVSDIKWLSVETANRMLKILLTAGRQQDAMCVVNICKQRNPEESLDQHTLRTLLFTASFSKDVQLAIAILKVFTVVETGRPVLLDAMSLDVFFKLVWQRRFYNVLRVVWRYACAVGQTTYFMENRLRKSLAYGARFTRSSIHKNSSSVETRGTLWKAFAARIATGLVSAADFSEQGSTRAHDAIKSRRSQPASGLLEIKRFNLVHQLTDMLQKAYERDMEWKQRGLGQPKGMESNWPTAEAMFQEMMVTAVQVPMFDVQPLYEFAPQLEDDRALQPIIDQLLVAQ